MNRKQNRHKTKQKWNSYHRQTAIDKHFTPRIASDLEELDIDTSGIDVDFKSGESLYLHGPTSGGKTLVAAQLLLDEKMKAYLKGGNHLNKKFSFVSTPDLLFKIKDTFDNNETTERSIVSQYSKNIHFLILDDFGVVAKSSEWVLNTFYLIINGRYENKLPTIFTSNIDLNQVAELFDDRIASRIRRMCKVLRKKPWDEDS